jgi:predicted nucleic acid-binding protein
MGVILDSSVLIEAERGHLDIDRFINGREMQPFGLSVITFAELLHAVRRADSEKRPIKRSAYVEKVIELFPIYPFGIDTARAYAELWAGLLKKGIQIGAHDLIIASTAIALGFSVATFDKRDFERIEGLELGKW